MAVGAALLMVVTAAGWGQVTAQTGTPELPEDATEVPELQEDATGTPDGIPDGTPTGTADGTPDSTADGTPDDASEESGDEIRQEVPPPTPGSAFQVCVAAHRLEDGRVEIAVQRRSRGAGCGERLLPRRRLLPPDAAAGLWLVTAPLRIDGIVLRAAARRLAGGAVEVAIQLRSAEDGSWGARLLPQRRFVPATVEVDRWLSSSPVYARAPQRESYLQDAQVVSFYGNPRAPALGALGLGDPEEIADEIDRWSARYDRLNGDRDVISAFHVITGVSQSHPTPDGTWLGRLSDEYIAEYVEVARERGMLVFLDIQIGWSDALTEVQLLEPFLREPFVHVALDPEFATRHTGIRPGLVIGSMTGEEVNEVQRYLAAIAQAEGLPPKILMVHQFTPRMLLNREAVEDFAGVDLSIDMDGFGLIPVKVAGYNAFAVREPSERPAFKLFFDYDTPPMTPEQVQGLDPPPDLIIYQ